MAGDRNGSQKCFSVVQFIAEAGKPLAVIPNNWLLGGNKVCLWPTQFNDAKRWKAMREKWVPSSDWAECDLMIKYQSHTMEKANSMLKRFQENDEATCTSTDADLTAAMRLRRRKRCQKPSESDSEAESIVTANKPSNKTRTLPIVNLIASSTPNLNSTPKSVPSLPKSVPSSTPKSVDSNSRNTPSNASPFSSTSISRKSTMSPAVNDGRQSCKNCVTNTAAIERLHGCMLELLRQQRQSTSLLHRVIAQANGGKAIPCDVPERVEGLLCHSYQDLQGLNAHLRDQAELNKRVAFLSVFGGTSDLDVVRTILKKIFHKSLALKLNWVGTGGKKSITEFPRVISLVSLAVRVNLPTMKNNSIEQIIKRWLRNARDLNGGRNERYKPKRQSPSRRNVSPQSGGHDSDSDRSSTHRGRSRSMSRRHSNGDRSEPSRESVGNHPQDSDDDRPRTRDGKSHSRASSGNRRFKRTRPENTRRMSSHHDSDDDRTRPRDGKSRSRDGKSRSRDGKSRSRDGKSRSRDGKSRSRDGKSRSRDGKSRSRDGKSPSRDGKSRSRDSSTNQLFNRTRSEKNRSVSGGHDSDDDRVRTRDGKSRSRERDSDGDGSETPDGMSRIQPRSCIANSDRPFKRTCPEKKKGPSRSRSSSSLSCDEFLI